MKRAEQTSFFYLLLALGCFDQARQARHGATLRDIGRDYLMKATKVISEFDPEPTGVRLMKEPA
jgi:hypothetical protein